MITKYFLKQTFDGNVQSIPDTNGTKNLQDTQLSTFFFLSLLFALRLGGYIIEVSEIRERQAKQYGASVSGNWRLL